VEDKFRLALAGRELLMADLNPRPVPRAAVSERARLRNKRPASRDVQNFSQDES